ncbi:nitroreductase family protein [Rhizobium sp. LC145]|uniref:nitroreductase family protein n=1 Tax=Rhizobium sp. LC145 TaxID=1120688 RepID=UPI00062A400D|nr:nitroreductase family protein [Rhizobium sp. LC145]KKX30446.1 NAD(P)H nitroreductase [Rhizobium sp. LC145]TKT46424.1 nitroreductase family protein [Rhizobiaceae bacterium LC148]
MTHPTITLIEKRVSANLFDPSHTLPAADIERLVGLATRAPTAYNLQNWRFIAVQSPEAKARLRAIAYGQKKVSDAAVTFILCGRLPDAATLPDRLRPFIQAGFMPPAMADAWREGADTQYGGSQAARDEALRSATFGAATLIYAAEALGLSSSAIVGFDPDALREEFSLEPDEIPALLVAVGRAAEGNWPQKPRRPVSEVLDIL